MRYTLDDLDINNFVHAWLRHLATGSPEAVHLLHAATDDPFSGGCFLLRNVGPQKRTSFAATEQLILYAVLAVYQDPPCPGRDSPGKESTTTCNKRSPTPTPLAAQESPPPPHPRHGTPYYTCRR